jgi:hypothetical protein
MEKEFIPYEQALALKELGFDEKCLGYYDGSKTPMVKLTKHSTISAPLYQQAFRWFREKYNLHHEIFQLQKSCSYNFKIRTIEYKSDMKPFGDNKVIYEDGSWKKYESTELECLKKLIEIVKENVDKQR